jgi:hypothetical protein
MMLNGDALLSFLALAGHGSWSTFVRAVEDVTGTDFHAYFVARALCARGLLEFDWFGNRSWSIPPLTVVRLRSGRHLCIGILDEETASRLRQRGFVIDSSSEIVTRNIAYTRSEIWDAECRGAAALDELGEDIRFERQSLDAGASLLGALPQLGSIIAARPVVTLEEAVGEGETRLLNSETLTFNGEPSDAPDLNFEILRVKTSFGVARYYYVDSRGARRIELELALTFVAGRVGRHFLYYTDNVLAVDSAVPLPILVERSLHFSGARLTDTQTLRLGGRSYRCFTDVPMPMARVVAMKLLTGLQALPVSQVPVRTGDHH